MPLSSYPVPPDHIVAPEEFREFILEIHNAVFGLGEDVAGGLNSDNIPDATISGNSTVVSQGIDISTLQVGDHIQGTDQSLDLGGANQVLVVDAKDAVTKKHDPGTNHNLMIQAVALADGAATAVSVTSTDATDLPTVITLANEAKADINSLVTDVNNAIGVLNTLLANLRTANQQEV